jgi:Major Facilitator Superfamily
MGCKYIKCHHLPCDHYPNRVLAACLFGLEAIAIFVLILGAFAINIIIFIGIFGAAYGAKTLARPSMLAEYYGASHYARISSIMVIFLTLTTRAAPVGASFLCDHSGTYQPLLVLICCISLIATGIMVFMKSDRDPIPSPVLSVEAVDSSSA